MAFKQYTQCINCLLCYAACPQCGLNEDFIGPAALALAHRYNLDSRDGGKDERADVVASNEGVWECTFVGACSDVCPKHVDPAAAIQQTKISASLDWFKAKLMPGAKPMSRRPYVRKVERSWWLGHPRYVVYMVARDDEPVHRALLRPAWWSGSFAWRRVRPRGRASSPPPRARRASCSSSSVSPSPPITA